MRAVALVLGLAHALCAPIVGGGERASIRVLTYNIHHGEGRDERIDLPRIAAVIKRARPDLVALQEVDVKTKRSGGVDQAAELARLTGMHVAFGRAIDHEGGQYGNAILSRWPLREAKTHALPHRPEREARCVVVAAARPGGGLPDLLLASTHLQNGRKAVADRTAQTRRINELLAGRGPLPVVLAGDLNTIPGSPTMKLLAEQWENAAGASPPATCPADAPRWPIDHVLLHPAGRWRTLEVVVLKAPDASDPAPLLVVLAWTGAAR